MVVYAAGFAWLWVIEQRKRQKRKAIRQKKIERQRACESKGVVRSATIA